MENLFNETEINNMENLFNETEINNMETYFGQSEVYVFNVETTTCFDKANTIIQKPYYIGKSSWTDLLSSFNNKGSYIRKLIDNNIGKLKLDKYEKLSDEEKQLVDLVDTNIQHINF